MHQLNGNGLCLVELTLAKKTSRRPSSFNACSQTEEMAVSSAASACKVVTLRMSAGFLGPVRVNPTFTSGYFFWMVSFSPGRLSGTKSKRYKCVAPGSGTRNADQRLTARPMEWGTHPRERKAMRWLSYRRMRDVQGVRNCTDPIPLSDPAPVITHVFPFNFPDRGVVSRWVLIVSSRARVWATKSSPPRVFIFPY